MANTDNNQTKVTADNENSADSFVLSSTSNVTTSLAKQRKSIEGNVMQTDAPLMRYFDLADEADYSYVLGYN